MKFAALGAVLVFTATAAPVFAQTDNRFAIGVDYSVHAAPDRGARGHQGLGLLWRFGHGHSGWGWHWGLNWYEADFDLPVGGTTVEFGEVHIRPVMAGYGYTHRIGRTAVTADVLGGLALASVRIAESVDDLYRERLGAGSVSTPASLTFAMKPEVSVWYDLSEKIGLKFGASYMMSRPTVTVQTSLREERWRVRADMVQLRAGLAYSIF